jgi:deoxyribonuclease (pyrimidine dimer)
LSESGNKCRINFNKFAEIMTRINCGIPVQSLSDKHLLAEHREIKRICFRLSVRLLQDKFNDIPADFSSTKNGRVIFKELFWLDKGKYTLKRYKELHIECLQRGFNVTDFSKNWEIYKRKPEFFKDYQPTEEQISMIRERINERSKKKIWKTKANTT